MMLFLIGFMGCGKSTLGRQAAEEMGCAFADTDAMIEEATGKTVAEIFERDGEEAFRRIENRTLAALCSACKNIPGGIIVATGGGTPCYGRNLALMKRCGTVVYLRRSPEELYAILDGERRKRPKTAGLDDAGLRKFIERSLAERERFYSQAAAQIDCEGTSDEEAIRQIMEIAGAGRLLE